MSWIAGKVFVSSNGLTRYPGDACSEAEGWPNLDSYVQDGTVVWSGAVSTQTAEDVNATDGAAAETQIASEI